MFTTESKVSKKMIKSKYVSFEEYMSLLVLTCDIIDVYDGVKAIKENDKERTYLSSGEKTPLFGL